MLADQLTLTHPRRDYRRSAGAGAAPPPLAADLSTRKIPNRRRSNHQPGHAGAKADLEIFSQKRTSALAQSAAALGFASRARKLECEDESE